MLKYYLLPLEDAFSIFIYLALWLLMPIVIFHYRRFGRIHYDRGMIFYLFLLYSLCSICLVFLPLPDFSTSFCQDNSFSDHIKLTPFAFIDSIIKFGTIGLRKNSWLLFWNRAAIQQAFFNFLLLMPLGFFLRYYFRVNFLWAIIISFLVTLTIEVTQLTGIYGIYSCPYRTFDIDDLILNTSGAIVAYIITSWCGFLPLLPPLYSSSDCQAPKQVDLLRRLTAFLFDWFAINTIVHFGIYLFTSKYSHDHFLLLELTAYFTWFVIIPYWWQGQTLGKRLLLIKLISEYQLQLEFKQLLYRYSLILFIPFIVDRIFIYIFTKQLDSFNYDLLSIFYLLILIIEILLFIGLIIIRQDNLAIHDLLSKSKNVLTQD